MFVNVLVPLEEEGVQKKEQMKCLLSFKSYHFSAAERDVWLIRRGFRLLGGFFVMLGLERFRFYAPSLTVAALFLAAMLLVF